MEIYLCTESLEILVSVIQTFIAVTSSGVKLVYFPFGLVQIKFGIGKTRKACFCSLQIKTNVKAQLAVYPNRFLMSIFFTFLFYN